MKTRRTKTQKFVLKKEKGEEKKRKLALANANSERDRKVNFPSQPSRTVRVTRPFFGGNQPVEPQPVDGGAAAGGDDSGSSVTL